MIRINLLPFRAARKKENVKNQVAVFVTMIVVFVSMCIGYSGCQIQKIGKLKTNVKAEEQNLEKYTKAAAEVDRIKADITILQDRKNTVVLLKKDTTGPVKLLDYLAQLVAEPTLRFDGRPDQKLWLTNLLTSEKDDAQYVELSGLAMSNPDVANFLERLENFSEISIDAALGVKDSALAQGKAEDKEGDNKPSTYFSEVKLVTLAASQDPFLLSFKVFTIKCKKPLFVDDEGGQ